MYIYIYISVCVCVCVCVHCKKIEVKKCNHMENGFINLK